jgi:hypothetical protein
MGSGNDPMMDEGTAVAVFANTDDAAKAIERVKLVGTDPQTVSVVGRAFH